MADEWKHPVPRNLRLAEDPPAPLWLWALAWATLAGLLLLAVLSLSGCAKGNPAIQDAHAGAVLSWSQAVHGVLCRRYPERDSRGICSGPPGATVEAVRASWESLCLPEPPEGMADVCAWIREDLAAVSKEVPDGRDE